MLDQVDFDRLDGGIRRQIRALCRLDDYHGPCAVLFEYLLIAGSVALSDRVSLWFLPVSLMLIGSTQRFLAHFLHESSHKTFTRNRIVNLLGGTIFSGYLILQLYGPYRGTHVGEHHRRLGDAEGDPDYAFHIESGLYDARRPAGRLVWREILLPMLGLRTLAYLRYIATKRTLGDPSGNTVSVPVPLRVERMVFLTEWTLIFGVCVWLGFFWQLLLFWFLPLVTTNVAIGWLSEIAEHYPMPESERRRLLLTRNRHGWFVERFLFSRHNDRYHLVHHLNAGVPFWNLGRAHKVLLEDPGYASWDGIWAGILTVPRSRRGKETVLSYAVKYRRWRENGADPGAVGATFAELVMLARRPIDAIADDAAVLKEPVRSAG